MVQFARRMSLMPTLRMGGVIKAVVAWKQQNKAQAGSFVSFTLGDTEWGATQRFLDAVQASVVARPHKYTSNPPGDAHVLEALANDFARLGLENLDPHTQICITNGTLEGFTLASLVLLNPGEEAIVPAPYYFLYPYHVGMAGGQMKTIEAKVENNFKITPQELKAAITDKTRILFLNTPHNPTSGFYSKEELKGLARVLAQHKEVVIFSDEIYERFHLDGTEHTSLWSVAPELRDRILVFHSFSKTSGLSGLRPGSVAGPADIINQIKILKAPASWNTSTLAQEVIYEAASKPEEFEREMEALREKVRAGRSLMLDRFKYLGFPVLEAPAGMFLFPQIPDSLVIPRVKEIDGWSSLTRAEQFAFWLIDFGVTFAPGIDMGVPNHFRSLFAISESQIELGMNNLARALDSV